MKQSLNQSDNDYAGYLKKCDIAIFLAAKQWYYIKMLISETNRWDLFNTLGQMLSDPSSLLSQSLRVIQSQKKPEDYSRHHLDLYRKICRQIGQTRTDLISNRKIKDFK